MRNMELADSGVGKKLDMANYEGTGSNDGSVGGERKGPPSFGMERWMRAMNWVTTVWLVSTWKRRIVSSSYNESQLNFLFMTSLVIRTSLSFFIRLDEKANGSTLLQNHGEANWSLVKIKEVICHKGPIIGR